MVKADLGTKRACLACGMRFYDFDRRPIFCPGCGAEFDAENIIKSRKSRPVGKAVARAANVAGASDTDQDEVEGDNADELIETIVDDKTDSDIDFDDEVDVDEDGPGIIQDDIDDDENLIPSLNDKDDG